jgi:hypothetical protein
VSSCSSLVGPDFGGARLPNDPAISRKDLVAAVEDVWIIDRRVEPGPSARPRLGASIVLTTIRAGEKSALL